MTEEDKAPGGLALAGLIGLFVLLALPALIWPIDPHLDERRYSIAAAHMMATGDYLVPISETGELRLTKPPLTYYHVVAGFVLFGQGLFGAKVAFLASAAAILGVTYALARALGAVRPAALLAVAMLAGHRVFFATAPQYIPDMPLVLGTSLAALGFVHVLRGTARPLHMYLAWLGLAWAVLAKGFLAPLMLLPYLALRPGAPSGPQLRWHEAVAALLALVLASGWFGLMAVLHPDTLMTQFFGDQVTDKVGKDALDVLAGLGKTTADLLLSALPGLLVVALARMAGGRRGADAPPIASRAAGFLLAWVVLNLVVFAFSTKLYERYTLPAAPALAALLALYASGLTRAALETGLRRAMRLLLPLLALAMLLGGIVALRHGAPGWGVAALAVALAGVPLLWRALGRTPLAAGLASVLLVFPGIALSRLPIDQALFLPSAGQIAAAWVQDLSDGQRAMVIARTAELVDQIGVQTGDILALGYAIDFDPARDADAALVVFTDPGFRSPIEAAGYMVAVVPVLNDLALRLDQIGATLALPDAQAVRDRYGTPLFLATRG
ncbi:ArnT family glycosyltransferase [Thetidibacter halocola]|uniref:Glycosyltransferase family 39 protein n=1 Tax=Thetidibacter halocola TaxID=2827239 RepID=A0A8J7WEJ2_9RHOB|nr:glycosyltransferase family 39 protein [Thetidibacter halocola]MBS0126175.1 glycosyltransferase family 39 protein [Thetidibacter halocola]